MTSDTCYRGGVCDIRDGACTSCGVVAALEDVRGTRAAGLRHASSAQTDPARIESSNEIAGIIIDQSAKHRPDYFMDLTLRYAIADAILAAGYRKPVEGV